jgi:hypothetical protein
VKLQAEGPWPQDQVSPLGEGGMRPTTPSHCWEVSRSRRTAAPLPPRVCLLPTAPPPQRTRGAPYKAAQWRNAHRPGRAQRPLALFGRLLERAQPARCAAARLGSARLGPARSGAAQAAQVSPEPLRFPAGRCCHRARGHGCGSLLTLS